MTDRRPEDTDPARRPGDDRRGFVDAMVDMCVRSSGSNGDAAPDPVVLRPIVEMLMDALSPLAPSTSPHPVLGHLVGAEVLRLRKEVAHWKAASTEMAARNAVLRDRPDLPVDRLPALARLERIFEEKADAAYRSGVSDERSACLEAARAEMRSNEVSSGSASESGNSEDATRRRIGAEACGDVVAAIERRNG